METTGTDDATSSTGAADAADAADERRSTHPEHDVTQFDSPDEAPDDLLEEIDQERERRLDPDNRPDGAEVDNTERDFVVERGRFEDTDVDEELGPYAVEDEA